MSNFLNLSFVITIILCRIVNASGSGIDLGSCSNYAVQAGTAVTFNGGLTTIAVGSVGVSPGTSIVGSYTVDDGSVEINSVSSIQCAADELVAYNAAAAAICTNLLATSDLSGLTLYPGVYCTGSGFMTISTSTVTLDGQGNSDAVWIFQTASSLVTGTGTSFILQNGAIASNVYWKIGSSASIAYSSEIVGTILAYASITLGSSAVLTGRALAQAAVTFSSGNTVTSFEESKSDLLSKSYSTPIEIGNCDSFAVLAGSAVAFNGVTSTITSGSIGVSPGSSISGSYTLDNGNTEKNTALSIQCASDELSAYNDAAATTCTNTLPSADLSGLILTPGVYCSPSSTLSISTSFVTLDGQGNPNAVWLFQTASTLVTAVGTSFVLVNGAKASNVFWLIGSSATIAGTEFVGTILAAGSITFSPSATLTGRAFAQAAVTFASGNTVSPYVETTFEPTFFPSTNPSFQPTFFPSTNPTFSPTYNPSGSYDCTFECMQYEYCHYPSSTPTFKPTYAPRYSPTQKPSAVGQTNHPSKDHSKLSRYPHTTPTSSPTNDCLAICKKSPYCHFPTN